MLHKKRKPHPILQLQVPIVTLFYNKKTWCLTHHFFPQCLAQTRLKSWFKWQLLPAQSWELEFGFQTLFYIILKYSLFQSLPASYFQSVFNMLICLNLFWNANSLFARLETPPDYHTDRTQLGLFPGIQLTSLLAMHLLFMIHLFIYIFIIYLLIIHYSW